MSKHRMTPGSRGQLWNGNQHFYSCSVKGASEHFKIPERRLCANLLIIVLTIVEEHGSRANMR